MKRTWNILPSWLHCQRSNKMHLPSEHISQTYSDRSLPTLCAMKNLQQLFLVNFSWFVTNVIYLCLRNNRNCTKKSYIKIIFSTNKLCIYSVFIKEKVCYNYIWPNGHHDPIRSDPLRHGLISSSCCAVPAHGLCLQPRHGPRVRPCRAGPCSCRPRPCTILQVLTQFFKTNSNIELLKTTDSPLKKKKKTTDSVKHMQTRLH
jgi:hypothetical protein